VIVEEMEEFDELLNNDTANMASDPLFTFEVNHLRNKLNKVLDATNTAYNYDCTALGGFKTNPDWAAFIADDGELGIARTDVYALEIIMDAQATAYADYTVQDAIELGNAIKKASASFKTAANRLSANFSGCPCADGCSA